MKKILTTILFTTTTLLTSCQDKSNIVVTGQITEEATRNSTLQEPVTLMHQGFLKVAHEQGNLSLLTAQVNVGRLTNIINFHIK